MKIAIIPARGRSKRIKKKNIKIFRGRPIIEWIFEIVKSSNLFDYIIVSTDNDEIKKIAKKNNILVPFKRPSYLCDDYSGTGPVMSHAVSWLEKKGIVSNEICCIYPTAVTLHKNDLIKSYKEFSKKKYNYLFSATEYAHPIQGAFYFNKKNKIKRFDCGHYKGEFKSGKFLERRSQDVIKSYHDAGQFYWGTFQAWKKNQNIYKEKSSIYIIPNYRVVDINYENDWKRAELVFDILRKNKK
mgnify:CR=1 FL=1|tara:strand:+ start:78 stop:803 length:726 start_codon:yes stop_codon:yes gene_type:complete